MRDVSGFKKRFHMLAIPSKIEVSKILGNAIRNGYYASGNPISAADAVLLKELSVWADENIFFNKMPAGNYNNKGSKWNES